MKDINELAKKRADYLIQLNVQYDGKVVDLVNGIANILKEYNKKREDILKSSKVGEVLMMDAKIIAKLGEAEKEATEKLNNLFNSLPNDLKKAFT